MEMNKNTHTRTRNLGIIMHIYKNFWLYAHVCIQWNLSNQDTIGSAENVLNSEVSTFQTLLSTQMDR